MRESRTNSMPSQVATLLLLVALLAPAGCADETVAPTRHRAAEQPTTTPAVPMPTNGPATSGSIPAGFEVPGTAAPPTAGVANPSDGPCPLLGADELDAALAGVTTPDLAPGLGPATLAARDGEVVELGCTYDLGVATVAVWVSPLGAGSTGPGTGRPGGAQQRYRDDPSASVEGLGDRSAVSETIDRSSRRTAQAWVQVGSTLLTVRVVGGPMDAATPRSGNEGWADGQAAVIAATVARVSVSHL